MGFPWTFGIPSVCMDFTVFSTKRNLSFSSIFHRLLEEPLSSKGMNCWGGFYIRYPKRPVHIQRDPFCWKQPKTELFWSRLGFRSKVNETGNKFVFIDETIILYYLKYSAASLIRYICSTFFFFVVHFTIYLMSFIILWGRQYFSCYIYVEMKD